MKLFLHLACLLCLACPLATFAQENDFERFIKKFPVKSLPYACAVNPKAKFGKAAQISKKEAETFLLSCKNTDGADVQFYDGLITPFGPVKNEEGRIGLSKATAQRVALLKRTPTYILILTRLVFEQKGYDNVEGEQYILHSFKPTGESITALPIAQRVQFDLHANEVSGTIDAEGNIKTLVKILSLSDPGEREEKYKILESGKIEEIKN